MDYAQWFQWGTSVVVALVLLANMIVKITPTPADDAVVAGIYKLVVKFAGMFNVQVADLPKPTEDVPAETPAETPAEPPKEA